MGIYTSEDGGVYPSEDGLYFTSNNATYLTLKGERYTLAAITIQRWWKMCKARKIRDWLQSIEANLETIYEHDERNSGERNSGERNSDEQDTERNSGERNSGERDNVVGRVTLYEQLMSFFNRLSLFLSNFMSKFQW